MNADQLGSPTRRKVLGWSPNFVGSHARVRVDAGSQQAIAMASHDMPACAEAHKRGRVQVRFVAACAIASRRSRPCHRVFSH